MWEEYCAGDHAHLGPLPADVPAGPHREYRWEGWSGWADWLGLASRGGVARRFLPLVKARAFVRKLGLGKTEEWRAYCRGELRHAPPLPKNIPREPRTVYAAEGWQSMGDWLGTGRIASALRMFRPFGEARAFARALELPSESGWRRYCRGELTKKPLFPDDIPAHPDRVYRDQGWRTWGDFLGSGRSGMKTSRPFAAARAFARRVGLATQAEWLSWCRGELVGRPPRPFDIPVSPYEVYAGQFRGWSDFLGTGKPRPGFGEYLSFHDARAFARGLALASEAEWRACSRGELPGKARPANVPSNPNHYYRDAGWQSWSDFLGTSGLPRRRSYWPYERTERFVRLLGLRSTDEFRAWCRGERPDLPPRPSELPTRPYRIYAGKGWRSWGEWFGTGYVATSARRFRSLARARAFARRLRLSGEDAWRDFCRGRLPLKETRPSDIPGSPSVVYRDEGWHSWADFLGTSRTRGKSRPFHEARAFARGLALASIREWQAWCCSELRGKPARPLDILLAPQNVYREFEGWGDFLGTGTVAPGAPSYRRFARARSFARSLRLLSRKAWRAYCDGQLDEVPPLPADIPKSPAWVYRARGWKGWADFLGRA